MYITRECFPVLWPSCLVSYVCYDEVFTNKESILLFLVKRSNLPEHIQGSPVSASELEMRDPFPVS